MKDVQIKDLNTFVPAKSTFIRRMLAQSMMKGRLPGKVV
jgi:hypothetical protein